MESSFIKGVGGVIYIFGVILAVCIFWHFMFEFQSQQHAHEKSMQTVQIEHEKQVALLAKAEGAKGKKVQWLEKTVEIFVSVGQKFIGM